MRSRTLPAEDVRPTRLILLLVEGKSYSAIRHALGCNPNYISRWKGRFEAERLAGLYSHYRGRWRRCWRSQGRQVIDGAGHRRGPSWIRLSVSSTGS
jgi:transposase